MDALKLRPLLESDAEMLYAWRCDAQVVETSESREAPTKAEHLDWMAERMRSPFWKVMIAELDGVAVATYTAQPIAQGVARLSYMVAEGFRLRGIGKALLEAALATMPRSYAELVIAEHNLASIMTAKACGFEERFGGVSPGFVRFTKVTP